MDGEKLPFLGASLSYLIAAGYSSGAFMSANLLMAYPEKFKGVGLLNGGLPSQLPRKNEYFKM